MRQFAKILILTAIMALTALNAGADKYERAWKLVDNDIAMDLPESAADKVGDIFDMAAGDHDSKQMLKSAVYMSQIESMMVGDNLESSIKLFDGLLPKLGQREYKAICHAFIAKAYLQYWNSNRWKIQRNLPQDRPASLDEMTARQLCDTIMDHLQLSIDMAGEARSQWFEDFFPGGNKEGMRLRPALVDLLLDNAVTEISGQRLNAGQKKLLGDKRLYGTAQQFVEATAGIGPDDADLWQLYVLNRMAVRNYGSKPDTRSTIDSRRMEVLGGMLSGSYDRSWSDADSLWVEGMARLGESYGKKVSFASVFMSRAAQRIMDNRHSMTDDQEIRYVSMARDLCNRARKLWPKSEGAFDCLGILAEIEAKEVNLTIAGDLMSGNSNLAMFDYRNVGTVYFRVMEVAGELKDMNVASVLDQLARCTVVSEWKNVMGSPDDYVTHYGLTRIPPLMQGSYYILASTGSNFGAKDIISLAYAECRGLTFMPMETEKGNIEGFFISPRTGQPVPDVKYTLWQLDYNDNQTKIAKYGFGDADGHVLVDGLKEGRYSFELTRGADMGNSKASVGYVRGMPQEETVRLFTDRYTYRPGDSVQFAVLHYRKTGLEVATVIAGAPVKVMLRNASAKEIASVSLVTDSMGMAMGSIRIPAGSMPGSFNLVAVAGEQGRTVNRWNSINVENFNQPKFNIEFDAFDGLRYFDREISITGRVMTETGQPVAGAQVQWSANLSGSEVDIFKLRNSDGYIRFAGGQLLTGADGRFTLRFTVSSDMTYGDSEATSVRTAVQVTDLNGETRNTDINVLVGKGSRHLQAAWNQGMVSEGDSLRISLTDAGKNVEGQVRLRISPLVQAAGLAVPMQESGQVLAGLNERERRELTKSALKQELAQYFPNYCLDFSNVTVAGEPVLDKTVSTGHDGAAVGLELDRSGQYMVLMESEQALEYRTEETFILESDHEWVPDGRLLTARPEKKTVNVGETAVIRFGNRYAGSVILYSVLDRQGMKKYGTLVSEGRQMRLEIPVDASMEGGFTVHLASMYENVTNYENVHFEVPFASHSLIGSVEHGENSLRPGDDMNWNFRLTDSKGGAVRARLLLDMYDSSLDVFGANSWQLQPWSGVMPYVGIPYGNRYAMQYNPAWYGDGKVKAYTGKVALTGILLDPITMIDRQLSGKMAGYGLRGSVLALMDSNTRASATMAKVQMSSADTDALDEESMALDSENAGDMTVSAENLRTGLDPTGLFISLDTDSNGVATVSFPAPQLLTKWKVQGIMWTDSLSVGKVQFEKITEKDLMIEPAAPRFVRQGDRLDFSFKIMNLTDTDMDVKAGIDLKDAVLEKPLKALAGGKSSMSSKVHVPAGGSAMAVYTVNVPGGDLQAMEYTLSATCGKYQDALRQTLPVLSSRTLVTKSISLFNNGGETRSFSFDELRKPLSPTAAGERVVIEYSSTPIWYAIQCLPTLIKADDPSSLRLAHSIMGAASALEIMARNPDVREMIRQWATEPASGWQSRLERNEDLTATLADATPWYSQTQTEKDRLRSLGRALDDGLLKEQLAGAMDKLADMQLDGGGWPWMEGMGPAAHITLSILECLGTLRENGAISFDNRMESAVSSALTWLDSHFAKDFEAKDKPQSVGALQLSYLLVIQSLGDISYFGKRSDVHKFYRNLAEKQDTKDLTLMERAQLALVLAGDGSQRAEHVVQTMLERSVMEDEMGRYWKDNRSGYRWQDAPIEAQSLAIKALLATGHRQEAQECSRWLLKQRQTSDWGTSPATANAVVALLAADKGQVRLEPDITVSLGKRSFNSAENSGNGYMKVEIPGRANPQAAAIKVESKSQGVSWGAVYYQYTDELDNVTESENGIRLERSLWRVESGADGDYLQDIQAGARLQVGDRVRVRLKVSVSRAMEYVQIRDMWAAGFEPEDTGGGWRGGRFGGRGHYMAPGQSCTDFYFDRLDTGTFEIEYDMFVQKAGVFQAGRATAQCLYSPDMRAGSNAIKVEVRK